MPFVAGCAIFIIEDRTVQRMEDDGILLCYCFQTFEQFEMDGCDNCDEWLHMKNNTDAVYDCTSSNFDG